MAVASSITQPLGRLIEASKALGRGEFQHRVSVIGWNVSNGELVWSDETFRIFEYSQTVKPTLELVLERIHPEDVALVQQLIDRVALGGTDWDLEHRLLMPDGSVKYVRAVAHAVRDSSGQPVFVGAVVDLTPSKCAEEATPGNLEQRARPKSSEAVRDSKVSAEMLVNYAISK